MPKKRNFKRSDDRQNRSRQELMRRRARAQQSKTTLIAVCLALVFGCGFILVLVANSSRQTSEQDHPTVRNSSKDILKRESAKPDGNSSTAPIGKRSNEVAEKEQRVIDDPIASDLGPPKPAAKETKKLRKIHDKVIWQAGVLNGLPFSPSDPLIRDEFTSLSYASETHPVRSPRDFPQVLRSRQALRLELDLSRKQDLQFSLILNSSVPRKSPFPWLNDDDGQFVEILWNDRVLYEKWMLHSSNWVSVFVPQSSVLSGNNTLVIHSKAGRDFAVDAAWLEPAEGKRRTWIAFQDAEWLGEEYAKHVPYMALELQCSMSTLSREEVKALPDGSKEPIKQITERQRLWRSVNWKEYEQLFPEDDRDKFQNAKKRIGMVLLRGAEPVCIIDDYGRRKRPEGLRYVSAFHRLVKYWYIDCDNDKVTAKYGRGTAIDQSKWGDNNVCLPASSAFLMPEKLGTYRNQLFRSGTYGAPVWPSLYGLQLTGATGIDRQKRRSLEIAQFTSAWLHYGGRNVVLNGLGPRGAVFPVPGKAPGPIWSLVRLFGDFSQGNPVRIPCNVIPYEGGHGLLDTTWCAVENTKEQVSIMVFAATDKGRQVDIECPVPWSPQSTVAQINGLNIGYYELPSELEPQTLSVRVSENGSGGIVYLKTELAPFNLIQIRPKSSREIRQPVVDPVSRAPVNRARPNPHLFSKIHTRIRENRWMTPLINHRIYVRLGENSQVETCAATPGTIEGEGNTIPWNSESLKVKFKSPSDKDAASSVMLYVDLAQYPYAEDLVFWVYPDSSGTRNSVRLRAGTTDRQGEVILKKGEWHGLRVSVRDLLGKHRRSFYLQIWPRQSDIHDGGHVSFEFNSIHAEGTEVAPGKTVSTRAKLMSLVDNKKKITLLILAPVDEPFFLNHRINMNDAKRINCSLDSAFINHAKELGIMQIGMKKVPLFNPEIQDINQVPSQYHDKVKKGTHNSIIVTMERE